MWEGGSEKGCHGDNGIKLEVLWWILRPGRVVKNQRMVSNIRATKRSCTDFDNDILWVLHCSSLEMLSEVCVYEVNEL